MTQTQFRTAIDALYRLAKHQESINGVDWETNLISIVKVTVESERTIERVNVSIPVPDRQIPPEGNNLSGTGIRTHGE